MSIEMKTYKGKTNKDIETNIKDCKTPYSKYEVKILKSEDHYLIMVFYTVWDSDNQRYNRKLSWKDVDCDGIYCKELVKELTPTKDNKDTISLYGCDWRYDFPYAPVYKETWINALKNIAEVSFKQIAYIEKDLYNEYRRDINNENDKLNAIVQRIQVKADLFIGD